MTVHTDWIHNRREQWILALENNASRKVLGMTETDTQSAARSDELLNDVRQEHETDVPIIKMTIDHRSEFVNTHENYPPDLEHTFDGYLAENDIMHTLLKVGRPQSNRRIERFY